MVLYNYSHGLLVRLPGKSRMILMNNSTLWFHGSSVYLLPRGVMLVSNRITKLHTFLVSVTCLKYQSLQARYGFEVTLRQLSRTCYTITESPGFLIIPRQAGCSFYWILSLIQPIEQELLFHTPHSVVLLMSLVSLQLDLTLCVLTVSAG